MTPRTCVWITAALAVYSIAVSAETRVIGTYTGPVVEMPLQDTSLSLQGGQELPFGDVFRNYRPATGLFMKRLPFDWLDMRVVHDPGLLTVLPLYDANHNGWIEEPEQTVFYLVEAARGLGFDVTQLGGNPPVQAIAVSNREIGGLMNFVDQNRDAFDERTRNYFEEMDRLSAQEATKADGGGRRSVDE
jgi:hypothetical protein